jgi:hypothetical protein
MQIRVGLGMLIDKREPLFGKRLHAVQTVRVFRKGYYLSFKVETEIAQQGQPGICGHSSTAEHGHIANDNQLIPGNGVGSAGICKYPL